ncbi:hypothetical protein NQ318_000477 [Aromia moschata]|uniref:Uncharacterized protein n=1 Tax=Aromia moschata TaxID=1265417 RepID=A0AAV8YU61_9CUCU|nr:hypothetical protein NQ318_000477 [Aromia moschata]
MLLKVLLLFFVPLCFCQPTKLTFKNVTFRGYNLYTEKFKKTIPSSNSLKEFLPESVFDEIEFKEQYIPVLYEDSLADLEDLDELVIEYCQVLEIQAGALKNVPWLRRFSLKDSDGLISHPDLQQKLGSGNNLERIEEGVFNNLPISTLDLSLNSISNIESGAFDDLPGILNINLADNKIAKWNPNWFKNTPLLTRISMQNNSITKLPNGAFKNLAGDKKFGKVYLTINIVLSYNKIKVIEPKAFKGLTKINNLWLDNNRIEVFDEDLLDNIEVSDLRLNGNNIHCLDGDLGKVIKADMTHLDSNPFDCECLSEIKTWAEQNEKNIEIFFSEMDCTTQRIKNKMVALEKRLKEIRDQENDIEVAEGQPTSVPIK